jgi:hypothetical protein
MRKLTRNLLALIAVLVLNVGVGVGSVHAGAMLDGATPGGAPQSGDTLPAVILLPGLAAFAAFVLSAGGARWLSDQLAKSPRFKALSSTAKFVLVLIACGATGLLLDEMRVFLASMPDTVSRIDGWLRLVYPLFTFVVSQWRYGGTLMASGPPAAAAIKGEDMAMPPAGGLASWQVMTAFDQVPSGFVDSERRVPVQTPDGAGWPTYGGG